VPPALMNSAHVGDYMRTVALVWPYDLQRRKAASYAMRVGNHIAYHDPQNAAADPYRKLDDGEAFELPPNSLVYVRTKERFQLPDYIAARFNLHIDLVHKGLLLGTGPVVDPGFIGHLVVPLHNLTRNTYTLHAGQDLIWAEFTKTSLMPEWDAGALSTPQGRPLSDYIPFDKAKSDHEMAWYINKATKGAGPSGATANFPANSIPDRMIQSELVAKEAGQNAQTAKDEAKKASQAASTLRNWGIGLALGLMLGLATLVVAGYQLVNATQSMVREERARVTAANTSPSALDRAILRAEVLLLEYCATGDTPAAAALLPRLSLARDAANATAVREGSPAPYPSAPAQRGIACPE
jgi:deoxycytidine triphosphate deaminase